MNRVADLEELDEEEMLMRAIAMSLEEEEEEEKEDREVAEEELFCTKGKLLREAILLQNTDIITSFNFSDYSEVEDEEELLKKAIAMSMEQQ